MPGPIPKRSDQRRRRNTDGGEITSGSGPAVGIEVPEPDPHWHVAAVRWYRSLADSGQAGWYQPSDWAQAWIWAEFLSRALNQGARPSSQLIATWSAGATELMTTEGARRRLRMELERGGVVDDDENAAVAALDDYRTRFSS